MLNRLIKTIYPANDKNKSTSQKFVDILTIPNIVLLGEPGAGKTYLFLITHKLPPILKVCLA